ncbi:MAG: (Fe-S)-binding protein [Candidatus Helarchaeota archaeon]
MQHEKELLKELLKCVHCGKCRSVCPTTCLDEFNEISSPRGRARLAYGLFTKAIPPTQILIDKIYSCFYCGICQKICPSGVITSDLILKTREKLIKLGIAPKNIIQLLNTIIKSKNVYGLDQEDRLEWAFEVEDIIEDKIKISAELGFFVGCTASYKGMLAPQPESVVKILDFLGMDFTLLGNDEMCCGNPYFLGGGEVNNEIKEIVFNNIENFSKLKIKKLITACPGCYRIIHSVYPIIYGQQLPFEIVHVSQFFSDLITNGKLLFNKNINLKLTFQDPCELARHCNIYEEPRNIFKKIPGLELIELFPNRQDSLCCGGGGLVKALFPKLVDEHLKIKMEQISNCNTNLDGIITTCPSCQDNLQHGITFYNKNLEVIDLCELIWRALNI